MLNSVIFYHYLKQSSLTPLQQIGLNKKMLKSELIDQMAIENPHLSRSEVERVVVTVFETITQTLESGARVELRGFGAFSPRYRKPRIGRNPRTGSSVPVAEKYVPFFRTGKDLKERIDQTRKS